MENSGVDDIRLNAGRILPFHLTTARLILGFGRRALLRILNRREQLAVLFVDPGELVVEPGFRGSRPVMVVVANVSLDMRL